MFVSRKGFAFLHICAVSPFQLFQHFICRVDPYETVIDADFKHLMQDIVDIVDRGDFEPFLIHQVIVEPFDIRVLYTDKQLLPEYGSDKHIEHINVVLHGVVLDAALVLLP